MQVRQLRWTTVRQGGPFRQEPPLRLRRATRNPPNQYPNSPTFEPLLRHGKRRMARDQLPNLVLPCIHRLYLRDQTIEARRHNPLQLADLRTPCPPGPILSHPGPDKPNGLVSIAQ
jgi:hypothetical protein